MALGAEDDEHYEEGEILEEGEEIEEEPPRVHADNAAAEVSAVAVAVVATDTVAASTNKAPGPVPPPLAPTGAGHIAVHTDKSGQDALLPTPPRKRLHSEMRTLDNSYRSMPPPPPGMGTHHPPAYLPQQLRGYPPPPPPAQAPHQQKQMPYSYPPRMDHRQQYRPVTNNGSAPPRDRADDRDERFSCDLITRHPRQVPSSNVLLEFATWMDIAASRARRRLDIQDLQDLIVNIVDRSSTPSPFLMTPTLAPHVASPNRVCVVLLGNLHPSVLQKYRNELPFFDSCTSMPCVLAKAGAARRVESPLPELLYRFAKPPVDTKDVPIDELYYGHELTFLMVHSFGYSDELVLHPSGRFARKSQPQGGTWELDGDLLHLKWRQRHTVADESSSLASSASAAPAMLPREEQDDAYTLDVLVAEDDTMHYFTTDAITDKTYARDTPEHLGSAKRPKDQNRRIRLSLVKATIAEVPRAADGSLLRASALGMTSSSPITNGAAVSEGETGDAVDSDRDTDKSSSSSSSNKANRKQWKDEDFDYYVLSMAELKQHGYPISVETEQAALLAESNGASRDRFVQTRPRPNPSEVIIKCENDPSSAPHEPEDTAPSSTLDSKPASQPTKEEQLPNVYALDCEMCETDIGMELTRVTVVNVLGVVVYDQLVKPQSTIINYHTEFSGITAELLQSTRHILADVQRDLLDKFLFADTVLVGHSLTSDLRALRMVHTKVADTAILYPHQRGFPFKTSLKYLTKTFLGMDIQTKLQAGHDSAEDAVAALQLLLQKVEKGPLFGIPETTAVSTAYDTLVDKMATRKQCMSMIKFVHTAPVAAGSDEDVKKDAIESSDSIVTEEDAKPWHLYASGHLQVHLHSPMEHAKATTAGTAPSASIPNTVDVDGAMSDTSSDAEDLNPDLVSKHGHSEVAVGVQGPALAAVDEVSDSVALAERVRASMQRGDAVCWVEMNQDTKGNGVGFATDFLMNHGRWMESQFAYSKAVDSVLQQLRGDVLHEQGALLMVVPQSDLGMLRYLKGLRTRSKWKDGNPRVEMWTDDNQAAVSDAFRGTMDSCVFLSHH